MKRRILDSLATSLCDFLRSRNHDMAGYWGVGVICAESKRKRRAEFRFRIVPGSAIVITGREVTDSIRVTNKLVKFSLESIEGRISFSEAGRYSHGAERFNCRIVVAVMRKGRLGWGEKYVDCWPHDPARESRRAVTIRGRFSMLDWLKKLLN